jgi:signal transduction histidine kinase
LLASREFDRATTQSIALTIHRQSSLLVQMVNELLDLARIESGRGLDFAMKRQPLLPIVRDTVETVMMPNDPRRVELQPGAGERAWVVVDAAKLRQAVTNVVSNAFKYSAGKGAIRITLPTRTHEARDEVGIRVEDEGRGMTPEQLSRAFERFYRAEPAGPIPGTGLGLALTRDIVEAMHGRVEIASEPGRGTQVTLWLPRAP